MPALIRQESVESLVSRLFSSYRIGEVEQSAAEMVDLIASRARSITARTPWNQRKAAELIDVADRFLLALHQRLAKERAPLRARLQRQRDTLASQQFYLREWAAGGMYAQGRMLDAGQWATHFSTVRMAVPLLLILVFFAVVALGWGRLGPEFFWPGLLLWFLAWGFMEAYTFQTFKMVFQQRRFDALLRGDFARFAECQRQIATEDGPWRAMNREFPLWCVRGLAFAALLLLLINPGAMTEPAAAEASALAAAVSAQDASLHRQSDAVDKLAAKVDDLAAALPDEPIAEEAFAADELAPGTVAPPSVRILAGGSNGGRYIIGRVTVTVR